MPIELADDIFHVICPKCYKIVPKLRYSLHKNGKSCLSPARPPEDAWDKFSCKTCHKSFESEEDNDSHEPCKAASDYVPARKSKRVYDATSVPTANIRRCDTRRSMMGTNRTVAISSAAMRKPNTDGTYNVNGQVTSFQDIRK